MIHAINPPDLVLITGDITDAGRAAEWAEFFDAIAQYPRIASLVLALPGNHDVNVVDRSNPARLDLPMSPKKRLRHIRTMSALSAIQGASVHIVDRETQRLGQTLEKALEPYKAKMAAFADKGSVGLSISLARLWAIMFPMVKPLNTEDGLGIIILIRTRRPISHSLTLWGWSLPSKPKPSKPSLVSTPVPTGSSHSTITSWNIRSR